MASAYSLAINNNTILNSQIINQSFDLDEVLTISTTTRSSTSSTPDDQKIEDTNTNTNMNTNSSDQLIITVSDLPAINIIAATEAGVCTVCMEDFDQQQQAIACKQAPCGHVFHATCISTWISISNSCPVCRSGVTAGS